MNIETALLTVICVLSLTASAPTSAEDLLGLYVGGSVGEAHVRSTDDISPTAGNDYSLMFDQSSSGWKALAGIRPISVAGIEVAYTDFGRATAPFPFVGTSLPLPPTNTPFSFISNSAKQSAATMFAIGYLPLPVPFCTTAH
jgi:hypothetical protein